MGDENFSAPLIVRNHVLIEEPPHSDQVQTGSTVTFEEDGGPAETYKIVGPAEADYTAGRISFEWDLGRALLGLKVGQEAEVKTATGATYTVRVTAIE